MLFDFIKSLKFTLTLGFAASFCQLITV